MLAHLHPTAAPRFAGIYCRLAAGLGVVWMGGWIALLLVNGGYGAAGLVVLIGTALLAGAWAGARASAFLVVEAAALVALALQLPILLYVWADTAPLSVVGVLLLQAPIALAASRLGRR